MIKLQIKTGASTWTNVDLFEENPVIPFSYEAFDGQELDKVKNPLDINLSLPLTSSNIDIFNDFNPSSTAVGNIPNDDYDFRLYSGSNIIMRGKLYVAEIVYNTTAPFYNVQLEDSVIEFLKKLKTDKMADYYTDLNVQRSFSDTNQDDFFSDRQYGGDPAQNLYTDVSFPYIDMCGDEIWKGYPFRAYSQYGFSGERTNFVPAFQVKSFIERIFGQNSFDIKSKLFGINTTSSGDINVERPYFFTKGQLLCDDTYPANRFTFSLTPFREFVTKARPFEENYFANSSDRNNSLNLDNRRLHTKVNQGYNYTEGSSPALTEGNTHRLYKFPRSLALELGEVTGHVAPNATYQARIQQKQFTISSTDDEHVELTIPAIYNPTTGRVNVVYDIDQAQSTMTFRLNMVVYEDGYPKYEFPIRDTSGNIKVFDSSVMSKRESSYSLEFDQISGNIYGDLYYINVENGRGNDFVWQDNNGNAITTKNNALRLLHQDVQIRQEEIEIFAGSEYSISYRFEPLEGELFLHTYNELTKLVGFGLSDPQTMTVGVNDLTYLFSNYNGTYTEQKFGIIIEPTGEGRAPIRYNDDVNVWYSIDKSVEITPFESLKAILKRFNLNMIYDYTNDEFIIDPIKLIRGTNTENINDNIDDLKEIQISIDRDRARYLNIKNEDYGLFYDKEEDNVFGDLVQHEVNSRGDGDKNLDLGSALYKNLGGEEVVETIPDEARWRFNNSEQGYVRQEFTPVQDIGIRFGYLEKPTYKTMIYAPYSYSKGYTFENAAAGNGITAIEQDRGGSHRRFGTYYLSGRLVTDKPDSLNLDLSDSNGYVTMFLEDDKVYSMYKNKVKFNAVFDTDYLSDPYNNIAKNNFSLLNGYVYITKISGDIYENKMYATAEGIIL